MSTKLAKLGLALFLGGSQAATQVPGSATFTVNATVAAGCLVVGNPTQTTGVGFGMLDFGTSPAVISGTMNASIGMSGGNMAQIQCTSGTAVTMTLDGGQNAVGNQRRMKRAPNHYLPYSLYAAPGGNSPITPGVGISVDTTQGAMYLPVWGIATSPGSSLPAGSYSDTVQVVFSW